MDGKPASIPEDEMTAVIQLTLGVDQIGTLPKTALLPITLYASRLRPMSATTPSAVPALRSTARAFLELSLLCLAWRPPNRPALPPADSDPQADTAARKLLNTLTTERRRLLLSQRAALADTFLSLMAESGVERSSQPDADRALLRWVLSTLDPAALEYQEDAEVLGRVGLLHGELLSGRVGLGDPLPNPDPPGLQMLAQVLVLVGIHACLPHPGQAAEAGGIPSWLSVEPRVRALWWAARKDLGLATFPSLNEESEPLATLV